MYQIQGVHLACGKENILVVIIFNIILITGLLVVLLKYSKKLNNRIIIALSMILGGGISNLIDRLCRGYVVDYIDINNIISYPVFNFADIVIVIGEIIIVTYMVINTIKEQEK